VGELKLQLGAAPKSDKHHAALPYGDVPDFWTELRSRQEVAAEALKFTILTVARTAESSGARWDEVDLDAEVWTVPASRMKEGKEHRVALSKSAVAVLRRMQGRESEFVFPGSKGKPINRESMNAVLKRMDRKDGVTVHGFRSTFSDWAWEVMHDRDIASAALAHALGDKVERSYRRSDALKRRRKLMEEWANFCEGTVASAAGETGAASADATA
jgi:integrase